MSVARRPVTRTIDPRLVVLLAGILPAAWGAEKPVASAYEQLIAPMLRARCSECHGEQKQKAKLALHTWEALQRGSDAGPVVVAGNAAESSLIARLRLPLTDEEHMPPADQPQPSAAEIALLTRWIETGASVTVAVAELGLSADTLRGLDELPRKLAALEQAKGAADPLWEFDAVKVAAARAALAATVADLQKRFPGALSYESRTSAMLHFSAAGLGRAFGDDELARLAPLANELVFLDVAATGISDRSASVLGGFHALRTLRAGANALGDPTAAAIAGLPRLEHLALNATRVSPDAAEKLRRIPTLKAVRLAETAAEAAARQAGLPVIPGAADFPPPAAAASGAPEATKATPIE